MDLGTGGAGGPRLPLAPAISGGQAEIRVDAADPLAVPNAGLEVNLTGYTSTLIPPSASFEVSAVDIVGAYQAVFGLFQNTTLVPTPFFAVFTNTTDKLLALRYWFGFPIDPGAGYEFALTRATGTNWSFTLNGAPLGGNASAAGFDFGVPAATWASGISFSELALYGASPVLPPNVTVSLDFATLRPSGWYLPTLARASFVGSVGRPWGVEGNLQHPTLAPGETVSGIDIAPLLNGTDLWSGGPDSVSVSAQLPIATLPSLGSTRFSVSVSGPSGALSGVAVSFGGGAGGVYAPATVLTDPTGTAATVFTAPNVTSRTLAALRATVSTFGYRGNATADLNVTASVQVFLRAAANVTVPVSSTTAVTFTAATASGAPIPGLLVTFATTGAGGIQPTAAQTDGSGGVSVELLAPGAESDLQLRATVVEAGYWGSVVVGVHVAPRPVTGTTLSTVLYLGLGAGVAGVVLALVVRERRRRAPTLPLPPLPRLRAGPHAPGRAEEATHRPPSSGNP